MQNHVNASLNFQNDTILKCLNKVSLMALGSKKPSNEKKLDRLKEKSNESVVSMKNINEFIVTVMKNVFQP